LDNWLTVKQAQTLLNTQDANTTKGLESSDKTVALRIPETYAWLLYRFTC